MPQPELPEICACSENNSCDACWRATLAAREAYVC